MTTDSAARARDAARAAPLVRLVCPYFWDAGPVLCRVDSEREVVVAACGDVAKTVPLVVRYHARVGRAPCMASALQEKLKEWGYSNVTLRKGLE